MSLGPSKLRLSVTQSNETPVNHCHPEELIDILTHKSQQDRLSWLLSLPLTDITNALKYDRARLFYIMQQLGSQERWQWLKSLDKNIVADIIFTKDGGDKLIKIMHELANNDKISWLQSLNDDQLNILLCFDYNITASIVAELDQIANQQQRQQAQLDFLHLINDKTLHRLAKCDNKKTLAALDQLQRVKIDNELQYLNTYYRNDI